MRASFVRIGVFAALVGLFAGCLVLGGVRPAAATRADTSLDGIWRKVPQHGNSPWDLVQIKGSWEGGFTVRAAKPFTDVRCTYQAGTLLGRFIPIGGEIPFQRDRKINYLWQTVEHAGSPPCSTRLNPVPTNPKEQCGLPGQPVCNHITVTLWSTSSIRILMVGEYTRAGPLPGTNTISKPPSTEPKPPARPKPKPKPAARGTGWLELSVALRPSGVTSSRRFKICVKAVRGSTTLCYFLRGGQSREVANHGKRVQWPIGTELQACEDRYPDWATPPGCKTISIAKGRNHVSFVNSRDTKPPEIKALARGVTKPGMRTGLEFTLWDDSGAAAVHATLYQGGTVVASWVSGSLQADGGRQAWHLTLGGDLIGPLYFCAWADDRAGNRSVDESALRPPEFDDVRGSCAWISLLVPIEKVSNTCGGAGWDGYVWAQNFLLNEHTFPNSNVNPSAESFTVSFADACNLHDAAYGGQTVRDSINGGVIDTHSWSRPAADEKFYADMKKLCARHIPARATTALKNCLAAPLGAKGLYLGVDKIGWRFFDADLTKTGTQQRGHRCQFKPCT